MFERHRELRALDAALSELHRAARGARSGHSGLLAFTAPAGMGKSALLREARTRATAYGCTVLSGGGSETEQEVAFRLIRQFVQPVLATMDKAELRAFLGSWYDIVASALGLEARTLSSVPDPAGVRDGLDWVMTQLSVARKPLVLLLDDLHWADLESLSWLTSFAPRAADLPLLLVLAYRPDDLPPEAAPFRTLVERHANRPYALAPLSAAGVARIVRDEVGEGAQDVFCEECRTVTGGNPFETVELAIRLGEHDLRGTEDDLPAMRNLATAVKGPGIVRRLRSLGTATVRFAHAAAVLGAPFSPELAAGLAAVGAAQAAQSVEKLRAARILAEGEGPGGTLDFVHPLIATAIYRDVPDALRGGMHNAAVVAIRSAGLGPTAAARHLLELPCEGKPEAVDWLREAAHAYLCAGAPEAARRLLSRALQEPPLPEDRAPLLHELARATFLIDPRATVVHLREALTEPRIEPRLRASIVFLLSQALAHTDRMEEAAALAAAEAQRTEDARVRLRMLADHFVWSMFRTDEPGSADRSRRLAKLAGRLPGRSPEERRILGLRAWDALLRGEARQSVLRYAEDALRGGMSWTDDDRGFEIPVSVALAFMYCDQPRRAEELFHDGMTDCESKGWRGSHLAVGRTLFGYIRFRRGDLTGAEHWVRDGLRTAERVEGAVPAQWFAVGILVQTLLARGRIADARRVADEHRYGQVVPNAVIYPDPRTVYAELLLAEGRHAEAARLLEEVGEWLDGRDWRNPSWCPWRLDLSAALARTAPDRAARIAREAVAHARDFGAASVIGQALRVEADVTGGRAALGLYAEAVEHLEQSPSAYELARALVGHGAALCGEGRLQDAADRLYQGLEVAVHCGAEALAARARQELSAAGLRPLPLRYPQTDTLTGHERRAAELAAQGRAASVVAKELRLTEQGVRQLLSAVYRKLGTDPAGLVDALRALPRPRSAGLHSCGAGAAPGR